MMTIMAFEGAQMGKRLRSLEKKLNFDLQDTFCTEAWVEVVGGSNAVPQGAVVLCYEDNDIPDGGRKIQYCQDWVAGYFSAKGW